MIFRENFIFQTITFFWDTMLAEYLQLLVVSKYNFSRSPCIQLLCVCMLVCCVTGMQELSSLTLPVKTWTFLTGKATDTSLPLPLPFPFPFPIPFQLFSYFLFSPPLPFPCLLLSFSYPLLPIPILYHKNIY